jgi:hypothetical protein
LLEKEGAAVVHSKSAERPEKPYPDFPLFPHAAGMWTKKIKGKHESFGSWRTDPEGRDALAKYHRVISGVPEGPSGLSIGELCNRYLAIKTQQVEAGKRAPRTLKNYKQATDILVAHFGKHRVVDHLTVADFEGLMAVIEKEPSQGDKKKGRRKKRGPASVGNVVQVARMVFRYAYNAELIDKPARFGPTFKRPDRKEFRKVRAAKGSMMFPAEQIRALLEKADVQMKAMILLGINAGYGDVDCALVPKSAIDMKGGWLTFPRPKTAVDRGAPHFFQLQPMVE